MALSARGGADGRTDGETDQGIVRELFEGGRLPDVRTVGTWLCPVGRTRLLRLARSGFARSVSDLVYWRGEEPVGIVLRRADQAKTRYRFHMCSLCHTSQPGDDVALFVAPLAGEAGTEPAARSARTSVLSSPARPRRGWAHRCPRPRPVHTRLCARTVAGCWSASTGFLADVDRSS